MNRIIEMTKEKISCSELMFDRKVPISLIEAMMEKYPDGYNGEKWSALLLSFHSGVTQEFINRHPIINGEEWCNHLLVNRNYKH